MKYDSGEILNKAKEVIEGNSSIFFIEDITAYLPCSRSTFYVLFPEGSDGLDTIKELLNNNRITEKIKLRETFKSGASAEKIALYKLIGTEAERKALTTEWRDHSNNGGSFDPPIIKFDE